MKKIITLCMRASIVLMIITLYGCPYCLGPAMLLLKGYSKDFMYFDIEQGTISLFPNGKQYVSGVIADKEYSYSRIHISPSKSSDKYDIWGLYEVGSSPKSVKKVSMPKTDAWRLRSRSEDTYRRLSDMIAYLIKASDNFKGTFFIMLTDLAVAYDYQRYKPRKHRGVITYLIDGERAEYYTDLAYGEVLAQAVARRGIAGKTRMTEGLEDEQSVKAVIDAAESINDLRLFKISGDGNGTITISHGGKTESINPNEEYALRLTEAQIKLLPFRSKEREFIESSLCGTPSETRKSSGAFLKGIK